MNAHLVVILAHSALAMQVLSFRPRHPYFFRGHARHGSKVLRVLRQHEYQRHRIE
jgi:hypothetical protein